MRNYRLRIGDYAFYKKKVYIVTGFTKYKNYMRYILKRENYNGKIITKVVSYNAISCAM